MMSLCLVLKFHADALVHSFSGGSSGKSNQTSAGTGALPSLQLDLGCRHTLSSFSQSKFIFAIVSSTSRERDRPNGIPPDQSQPWMVNASVDYFGTLPQGARLSYVLRNDSNRTVCSGSLTDVNTTDSTVTGMTTIKDGEVELWWPSQLGKQNLYYMTISLDSPSNQCITSVTKRIGFRTIVLNQTPISQGQIALGIAPGSNWHFEVNGHEFYAKGSNFIPPDAFWPRVTPERISQLFDSVIDGKQNM